MTTGPPDSHRTDPDKVSIVLVYRLEGRLRESVSCRNHTPCPLRPFFLSLEVFVPGKWVMKHPSFYLGTIIVYKMTLLIPIFTCRKDTQESLFLTMRLDNLYRFCFVLFFVGRTYECISSLVFFRFGQSSNDPLGATPVSIIM